MNKPKQKVEEFSKKTYKILKKEIEEDIKRGIVSCTMD